MAVAAPKRMSREARRDALLDAAERVLHRHVLAELSFELVADEAGVSKTLPYSYFDSPADIATALYQRVIGTIDDRTDDVVANAVGFDAKLAAALDLWCDAIESDGRLVGTLLDGKAVKAVRPLIEDRDARSVELWRRVIEDEFGVPRLDAEYAAAMLTAAATAALLRWAGTRAPRSEVIDRLVRTGRAVAREFAP